MQIIEAETPPWVGRIVSCMACQSKLRIDEIGDVTVLLNKELNLTCPVCYTEANYDPKDFKIEVPTPQPTP